MSRAVSLVESQLDNADAAAFEAVVQRDKSRNAEAERALVASRDALETGVASEPFDAARATVAVVKTREALDRFIDSFSTMVIDALGRLSPAGRKKLVELRRERLDAFATMASLTPKGDGIIDTHHHFLPDFYFDALGRDAVAGVTPSHEAPKWSQADDLAVMDDYRIRKAVISAPLGGGQEPSREILLASRLNEFGADMVRSWPDRYAHFATIPLPDIDASLADAARALDTLDALPEHQPARGGEG